MPKIRPEKIKTFPVLFIFKTSWMFSDMLFASGCLFHHQFDFLPTYNN